MSKKQILTLSEIRFIKERLQSFQGKEKVCEELISEMKNKSGSSYDRYMKLLAEYRSEIEECKHILEMVNNA